MSTKSETGLGILLSDLALRISLNFTWNWSIRLYDSSDFNNVYRLESCRRYSWTRPIGFWGRGMQIKWKNQQIHGLYRGLTYSSTTMWHYWQWGHKRCTHESCTQVYAFLLLTLRFRKNNGRSNTAEIRRWWQSVRSPPILKENVGAKISYWPGQVWYFSSAKAQRTVVYTREQ